MREVVLQIPTLESEQNIDIEVKINGKKRTMHYRVEIVAWEAYDGESADKVDVICILSGDGDYVPLVHYLKSRGIKVEAMAFERTTSRELREAVDAFYPITEDMVVLTEPF